MAFLAVGLLGLAVSGCVHQGVGQSRFLASRGAEAFPASGEAAPILIIFSHGSGEEFHPDRCDPDRDVPQAIRDLAGRRIGGIPVLVYAFCSPSRIGEYVHQLRQGEPKVVKRARDIEALVGQFRAAGFPAGNIFLAGFSAGGWASLLVERDGKAGVAGVIAFAPAFAGRLATRAPGWWDLHRSQSAYLASAVRLDALVFAFSGDDFVRPDELRGVLDLPGARVVTLSSRSAGGCAGLDTHRGAFADCFEAIAASDVEAFIEDRLDGGVEVAGRQGSG